MKYIKTILLSIFCGMAFLSCSESFLDLQPKDKPSSDNFMNSTSSAMQLTVASISPLVTSMQMYGKRFAIICDGLTDDSGLRLNGLTDVQNWDITPTQQYARDWWKVTYYSVNAANYAIQEIPKLADKGVSQSEIDYYVAASRFMRAFDYLFLVTFYGDVPLNLKPLSSFEEFAQPRTPASEVYRQILDDFAFAKSHLEKDGKGFSGMPTRSAAAAFYAKTLLYMKDYAAAEAAAREAISVAEADGHYLIDDYESIFSIDNEENPELLFYFAYERNSGLWEQDFCVERNCRDIPGKLKYIQGGDGWGYALPSRSLYDAYEPGDPRREYTIYYDGVLFGKYTPNEPFTYNDYEYVNGKETSRSVTLNNGDDVLYDYKWSPTGFNVKKLTENLSGLTNVRFAGLDWPLMRMADLYLILAESLAEQNKDEALDWVNKVRARASVNMPPRTAEDGGLVDLVRHERRVELAMEGQRLYDLLRWDALKDVFGDGNKVKLHYNSDYLPMSSSDKFKTVPGLAKYPSNHILFPIPQDELDRNPSITANNPGY